MERKKATDLMYIDSSPAATKTELLNALSAELGYSVDASDPWAVVASCLLPFIVQTKAAADAGIKAHNVAFATGKALDILGAGCGLKRGGVSRAVDYVPINFSGLVKPGIGVYALEISVQLTNKDGDKATFTNAQTVWVNRGDMPFETYLAPVYAPEDGEEYNGYRLTDPENVGNTVSFRSLNDDTVIPASISASVGSSGGRSEDEGDDAFAERVYARLYSGGRTGTAETYKDLLLNNAPTPLGSIVDANAIDAVRYNTILTQYYSWDGGDASERFPVAEGDVVAVGLSSENLQEFSQKVAWGTEEALWGIYQRSVQNGAVVGQSAVFRPALGTLPVGSLKHGYDSFPIRVDVWLAEEDQNEESYAAIRDAFSSFVKWQTSSIGRAWSLDECTSRLMSAGAQHVVYSDSYGQAVGLLYYPTPEIGYVPAKFKKPNKDGTDDTFKLYIGGEAQ